MNTKKLLVALGVGALAYVGYTMYQKKKATDSKTADCQNELNEVLKVARISDIEGYKSQFMADCLSDTPKGVTTTE